MMVKIGKFLIELEDSILAMGTELKSYEYLAD